MEVHIRSSWVLFRETLKRFAAAFNRSMVIDVLMDYSEPQLSTDKRGFNPIFN
ncbi:hypothetical protein ZHAS_00015769 [Anopheles sinensis]|uniref:Uncharacterized protein n=1 Tax=Anopheles sinensis TaxID=74873 RepID=A0A084WC69_ANOSI|nr:hypothetical protein ZHAS_00015769 [Anopheles sinensis]